MTLWICEGCTLSGGTAGPWSEGSNDFNRIKKFHEFCKNFKPARKDEKLI